MRTFTKIFSRAHVRYIFPAAAITLLATGCSTYQQKNQVIRYWQQGNVAAAAKEATRQVEDNPHNKDTVIWRLEQGATLRANGQFEESNKAFDAAQDKMEQYAEAAKVSISKEAGALLSNQAELPYVGRTYDGIMLNTYEALNYLSLSNLDNVRVELIRAYQRQQDAVADNQRRIEKVQAEADKDKNKAAMDRTENDSKFKEQIQSTYSGLDDIKSYADYVNPFTVFLDGLYFMADATDGSDLERAHKSFERVEGFAGENDYIKQDLATVDDLINGKPLAPTTYVIFETGCAPIRDQIRIDIPIIFAKVSYVGAAFPVLKIQDNFIPSLTVTADNTNVTTALLSSMDAVIARDFKNELPVVITKTIASTVAKAASAYAINNAAGNQSSLGGLIAQIGTTIYETAVNIADTRTWTTLPKQFQYCRFPTPTDRKIELAAANGLQKTSVTIGDGVINIIYVKSIDTATPFLVTQMKLK